jgi:hypothetical protein
MLLISASENLAMTHSLFLAPWGQTVGNWNDIAKCLVGMEEENEEEEEEEGEEEASEYNGK